ncbi:MAG: YdcF family protein, partial [Mesorhizobium sp.]
PGPWTVFAGEGRFETPSADPTYIYQNVLVVLDADKGINNGEPLLHAMWLGKVEPKPGETWLLVTSAFHMPRAKALFDKAGFATIPWPVDYRTSGKEGVGFYRDNPMDSIQATTIAVREWIGLFAYRLSGKIDQLFPGPGG